MSQRLKGRQLQLTLDDAAKEFLLEKGYDPTYGARPMRRAVERNLEDPLAEENPQRQPPSQRADPGHRAGRQTRLPAEDTGGHTDRRSSRVGCKK